MNAVGSRPALKTNEGGSGLATVLPSVPLSDQRGGLIDPLTEP